LNDILCASVAARAHSSGEAGDGQTGPLAGEKATVAQFSLRQPGLPLDRRCGTGEHHGRGDGEAPTHRPYGLLALLAAGLAGRRHARLRLVNGWILTDRDGAKMERTGG
jgi:hypothetical protein